MTQIHILHAMSATEFAVQIAQGLEREGYSTSWDGQHGAMAAMSGKTVERLRSSVCLAVWTLEIWSAKWTREAVEEAHERGALVETALDLVPSPIQDSEVQPLDFSAWKGEYDSPLWKALMARIRETAGRPTGRLPLKEEAPPAMGVMALGLAAVAGLMAGGVPSVHVQSDSMAALQQPAAAAGGTASMGGPLAGLREPASAVSLSAHVTAHFDRLAPAPATHLVTIEAFNAPPAELASADPAPAAEQPTTDNPVL